MTNTKALIPAVTLIFLAAACTDQTVSGPLLKAPTESVAARSDGRLALHPGGFGSHSYSAWKAQEGLPDSRGNANHALYFQKMTTTATVIVRATILNRCRRKATRTCVIMRRHQLDSAVRRRDSRGRCRPGTPAPKRARLSERENEGRRAGRRRSR